MHSIWWFWTTGLHNPAWVQAVAAAALVVLTFVTLIVLSIYAWDTHTLAKTSVEQINLVKQERDTLAMRNFQAAYDCFLVVQDNVTAIMKSLENGTFGTRSHLPIYPENWPDVASALNQRISSTMQPTIALGIALRHVDFAVRDFFNSSNNDDKRAREMDVRKAANDAAEACKNLLRQLPKTEKS
jgi:hypothetical protein